MALLFFLGSQSVAANSCMDRLQDTYAARLNEYRQREESWAKEAEVRRKIQEEAEMGVLGKCARVLQEMLGIQSEVEQVSGKVTEASERKCVEKAQRKLAGIDRFVCCPEPGSAILVNKKFQFVKGPKITKTYTHLNTYLFKKITQCTDVPAHDLFRLAAFESGFHPNIVSTTGCLGIPQTDSGTIATLTALGTNGRATEKLYEPAALAAEKAAEELHRKIKGRPECEMFHPFVGKRVAKGAACEVLHAGVNPQMGYFLLAKNYATNLARIEKEMELWMEVFPMVKWDGLKNDLLIALATIAHNAGPAGVLERFPLAMKQFRKQLVGAGVSELVKFYGDYIRVNHPADLSRREEIAEYFDNARARFRGILAEMKGEKCF